MGYLSSKMLFLQWFTLIPWGLAALFIGYSSKNKKQAVVNGSVYGFFLGFVFLVFQYSGIDLLITKILPFILLGIVSAICGMLLSFMSYFVKFKVRKNS